MIRRSAGTRKSCSSWSASVGNVEAPGAKLSVFPSSWGARQPAQRKYGYQVDSRPQDEVYGPAVSRRPIELPITGI